MNTALVRFVRDEFIRRWASTVPARDSITPKEKNTLEVKLRAAVKAHPAELTDVEREALFNLVVDELIGYGPLTSLLRDPSARRIIVHSWDRVVVERENYPPRSQDIFDDRAHLARTIELITRIAPIGNVDEDAQTIQITAAGKTICVSKDAL